MEPITNLAINATEIREKPDHHVIFSITVQGQVRSWIVYRRFSEFDSLYQTLANAFPLAGPPPTTIPPKTYASLLHPFSSIPDDPKKIEMRRLGLERFLQDILNVADTRWRTHPAWYDFLIVPEAARLTPPNLLLSRPSDPYFSPTAVSFPTVSTGVTPESLVSAEKWMEEYRNLITHMHEIRAHVAARDKHAAGNDINASQSAAMQGKKGLAIAATRIQNLESALKLQEKMGDGVIGSGITLDFGRMLSFNKEPVLSRGEILRRSDLLINLRDEREIVAKLLNSPANKHLADSSERASLFGLPLGKLTQTAQVSVDDVGSKAQKFGSRPASWSSAGIKTAPVVTTRQARKFGVRNDKPAQETQITRTLDNEGLVAYQRNIMNEQDTSVEQLLNIVNRQKQIGIQIGNELDIHNQMLDDLDQNVTRVQSHMKSASKKLDLVRDTS
ncbi:hypothetical protein HK096_007057 [Nowakowskiella sp. JEL0078]|nr:hypothetical protein HK096_007057 [Nowakowskiella sp. JEL0078]